MEGGDIGNGLGEEAHLQGFANQIARRQLAPVDEEPAWIVPAVVEPDTEPDNTLDTTVTTASGKTSLALRLAEEFNGEIVSCDSVAVYRDMEIGTAKVPVPERRGIPHHLLDRLSVTEPAAVAEFQGWARVEVSDG